MTCLTKTKHHIFSAKQLQSTLFYNAMVFPKVGLSVAKYQLFIRSNEHYFYICRETDIYRETDTERKTQDRPSKTHETYN